MRSLSFISISLQACRQVPFQIFSDPRTSYRENLGLFVEEKACLEKKRVKVLEIGVWRGDFAELILDRYHSVIEEYIMIEPAQKLQGSLTPELEQRLKEFPSKYPNTYFQHINEISVEAAPRFPDMYFDWIYIDALHTYKGVRDDIQYYWPKLRAGGMFSGHDFTSKQSNGSALFLAPWSGRRDGAEKAGFPGSYKAAIEHSRSEGLPIFHTLEGRSGRAMFELKDTGMYFRNNPSWFMFKGESEDHPHADGELKYTLLNGIFSQTL